MRIQHEGAQRPVQPRHTPTQIGETRARDGLRAFKIEAERRTDVEMFNHAFGRTRIAPAFDLDVLVFIRALRHVIGGQVGEGCQRICHALRRPLLLFFQLGIQAAHDRHLRQQFRRPRLILGGLGLTDGL